MKPSSLFARIFLRPKGYGVVRNKKEVPYWYCASLNKKVVMFLLYSKFIFLAEHAFGHITFKGYLHHESIFCQKVVLDMELMTFFI